jgi:membrane-associated phospholipid phosphatase
MAGMNPADATGRLEPRPHSLSPRGLAVAGWLSLIVAGWIFFDLAWDVATHDDIVLLDAHLAAWLHAHGSPQLTAIMLAVSALNSTVAIAGWSALFAVVLARLREWYWMLTLGLAVSGGLLLNVALKMAYERARPHFDDPWITLKTYSFPSGHTAGATLFYGVLCAFVVSRLYDWHARVACVVIAVLMVVIVAFSRMYLGAHYLSDVSAAACSSTAWLVLCLSTVHGLVRRRMAGR